MEVTIYRQSVCAADDINEHTIVYKITPFTKFSDMFQDLIKQDYFPKISGNDVVWTLFCDEVDLISWKTKENKFYSRFVDNEPAISSVKYWVSSAVMFKYYPSPLKRAQYIFTMFNGLKFHIWHDGFWPEYESYVVPKALEDIWDRTFCE